MEASHVLQVIREDRGATRHVYWAQKWEHYNSVKRRLVRSVEKVEEFMEGAGNRKKN